MMNARYALKLLGLLVTGTALSGCGGDGGSTETASAPAAAAPASSGGRSMAPPSDKNEGEPTSSGSVAGGGYGGGSTGGSSYGSQSSPGMGAPGPGGPGMMGMPGGGEESAMSGGYDMRSMAENSGKGGMSAMGGMESMGMGSPGGMGSGEYDEMYGSGYGEMAGMSGTGPSMGGPGMGMGMGQGMSGGANMRAVTQFISQNCFSCHGAANPKGGVRLIGVGDVASDPILWQSVHEQLEAGTMPPASSGLRPDPQQLQMVTNFLKEELSKSGLADQDYLSKAKFFFGSGREQEAIEYFYAHALTVDDEEAEQVLADARLFAAGKRPVVSLRFAVGVELQAPEGVDLKPIGTSQFGNGGSGGGMGSEMAGMPGGMGGNSNDKKERSLYDITGDFGKALVEAYESRWTAGAMGNAFKDATPPVRQPAANNLGGMGGGFGGPGMPGMGMDGGEEYGGGMMGSPSAGGQTGGRASEQILADQTIKPGLFYLGTGSRQDLLKKASEEGFDGLFLFDVEATLNRRVGTVNTTTSLRAMLVDGTVVGSTRSLVNTEVEREKLRGNDEDVVQTNIDRMFAKFDEVVQLTPMPKLSAESARRRIQQLIHDENVGQLQTLFEARLYHSLGSLSTDELATIYQIVLRGNEGESLAKGLAADRKLVMEQVFEQL